MEEGAKAVYTETEVDAAIAAEAVARDAAIAVEAAARAAAIVAHAADYGLHTALIVKAADETVNNSETLIDDAELKLAVAANEVWAFILLPITYSSVAAAVKAQFTVPSGAVLEGYYWGNRSDAAFDGSSLEAEGAFTMFGASDNYIFSCVLGVIINGSTAGNVQFQWAQNTAEESDTKVLKNSCILAWKLA